LIQSVVKSGLLVQKSEGNINTENDFDLNRYPANVENKVSS